MARRPAPPLPSPNPLRPLLRRWLLLGLLAVLLLPAARGHHLWIGWLPYWLVVAPALCLMVLERQRMTASLAAVVAGRRTRRVPGRQARRRALHLPARRLGLAALLGGR